MAALWAGVPYLYLNLTLSIEGVFFLAVISAWIHFVEYLETAEPGH